MDKLEVRLGREPMPGDIWTNSSQKVPSMSPGRRSPYTIFLLIACVLVGAIAVGLQRGLGLWWVLSAVIGVNVATLVLYGYDKLAAKSLWLRVPERVLHLLAFLGGTPAAIVGQQVFRHKTVKTSFRIVFWILAMVQVGLLVWWWWATTR